MTVNNYENRLIEQGSSWSFEFTLSKSYPADSTIRFVFPEGFSSSKIQCNITGIVDEDLKTRVFPNKHVYDCLNIKSQITPQQKVLISGVVNPDYSMLVDDIEMHLLQPNSRVVLEKIKMNPTGADSGVLIKHKDMNTTVTIPNKFRNNTVTYIFEFNMDSDLYAGDYIKINLDGNWTYFLEDSQFIEGINSDR